MLPELLAIVAGFGLLAWSADRFVYGASAIAVNLSVSPLVIGLTIVSLGTSAPEIIVSAVAAWEGNAGLSIGNALGSNIINTALILGITALIMPLNVHSSIVRRELPVLMLVMACTFLLFIDGILSRTDGLLLLAGMLVMLHWMVRMGRHQALAADPLETEISEALPGQIPMRRAVVQLLLGGVVLLASSRLLVWGAVSIAQSMGISDLVIGLTIVALGTSLPELAASVAGALKNEHDLAIGNIIGSNIFNLLAVLGVASAIQPIAVDPAVMSRDYPVLTGLTLMLFAMAWGLHRGQCRINRLEGALLLTGFGAYQTLLYFDYLH